MDRRGEMSRELLTGLLALQTGLIDQDQLVAAFAAWSREGRRPMAEILVERGALDAEQRSLLEALVAQNLRRHGGDAGASLAAVPAAGATRERLAALGDSELTTSLGRVGSQATAADDDERTATVAIGSATADGQRFRVLRPHARGGLGVVSVALDEELRREVALKQIQDEHADDPISRQRFLLEAEITGGLEHPGIVPVYGLGHDARGRPYYAMRFIRGDNLKEAIARFHADDSTRGDRGAYALGLRRLLRRFLDVCNAVDYAHGRGVLHRDLKPGNILVGQYGETLVVDWGLAKPVDRAESAGASGERTLRPRSASGSAETLPGSALGTPAYMSPEQAAGDLAGLGPRSDVYSLGATLYCLLTGRPPFEGDVGSVLRAVQAGEFPPPRKVDRRVDRALEAVCLKAMARCPEDRYEAPRALAEDLERWMADEPVSAWREPALVRARRWVGRRRTLVASTAAALAVAVAGLAAFAAFQARANRDLEAALERESNARALASDNSREAEQAIHAFFTGISEDVILRRPELEQLRNRLLSTALQFYQARVKRLEDGWVPKDPANLDTIAGGMLRIATLQSLLGDRESAIATRRRAIEIYDAMPSVDPFRVAAAVLDLGNLQRSAGKPGDALRSFRDALVRLEAATPYPWGQVATAQADLGRLLVDTGRADEGRRKLERAREIQESLLREVLKSPFDGARRSLLYKSNLGVTYTTLGNLADSEGRTAEALGWYEKVVTIYEDNAAALPNDTFYQAELARALNNLGLARATAGQVEEGRREIERGKTLREGLLADQPLNIEYRADLARSDYHLALVARLAGATTEALDAIDQAERLYSGIPPKAPEDRYFQAAMKAVRAGLLAADHPDESRTVADQAMALLTEAVALGYASPSRLRHDPPLASLRDRDDFRALLRRVESEVEAARLADDDEDEADPGRSLPPRLPSVNGHGAPP